MPTDLCRYCGGTYDLVHGHTCTPIRVTTGTGTPEEATRNVDPAEVQSFPELCLCGHPHSHHGSRPGQICITCEREDRHPARCWGWFPQGSKAIEVDELGEEVTDEANPRDQVGVDPTAPATATKGGDAHDDALDREQRGSRTAGAHVTGPAPADAEPAHPVWGYPFPGAGPPDSAFDLDWNDDERTPPLLERVPWRIGVLDKDLIEDPDAIVEHASWIAGWYVHDCAELLGLVRELPPPEVAAGPPDLDHAIQAAAEMAAYEAMMLGVGDDAYRAYHILAKLAVEAAAPVLLQATRDRLADLEVYAAELHDVLVQLWDLFGSAISSDPVKAFRTDGAEIGNRVRAVILAPTDPPARGRATLDEVQRLRQVAEWAEWVGTTTSTNAVGSASFCMACGGYRKAGHKDGCWLRAALDGPAAQEEGRGG